MDIRVPINNTLRSKSENYRSKLIFFKAFNEAHDPENKIKKFFTPKLKNKVVLDLGCGYGKYTKWFAPISKSYIGCDISPEEIFQARKIKELKANILYADANKLLLKDSSVDVAISIYGAISVVKPLTQKAKILKEVERVLKPGGVFYLVTDDFSGEWVNLKKRTKSRWGFDWLLDNGFKVDKKLNTCFDFETKNRAIFIIDSMFGRMLSDNITKAKIKHNIIILKKVNNSPKRKIVYRHFKKQNGAD